jgi:sarcosine oxidase delta subunit
LAERKNTGLAVSDAKRLNDCYHEVSEAIAARPEMPGDRDRWHYDYAALPGGPEGADREAWNHSCGSRDIAEDALRGAVTNGNLQLWTHGPHGEAKVDRHELKELTYRTFASGTYQPVNRLLDGAGLAGCVLWVKEADWHRYFANFWTVRYGLDWANPAPPVDKPLLPPESQFVTLSHALTWIAFAVSMGNDRLHEVLSGDRYGQHDPQEAIRDAVSQLADLAEAGKIAMRGKYRSGRNDDEKTLLTEAIEPIRLTDYRLFSYLDDELRRGPSHSGERGSRLGQPGQR